MWAEHLWVQDFRNYSAEEFLPAREGLTVVTGGNGQGKTNLLEAIGYVATARSLRGAPREALIRRGYQRAVIRAEVMRDTRRALFEAELAPNGRDRIQINRQVLRRTSDLCGVFQVSVFSPDDLVLIKGGPVERRRYLDETLSSLKPQIEQLRNDTEHVLRQRNVLLRQAGGRGTPSVLATLDVWDIQLARLGAELAEHREFLVNRLAPLVTSAYATLSEQSEVVTLSYRSSWKGDLGETLLSQRREDLRRGVTTVGPHRDDLEIALAAGGGIEDVSLPARTHVSQGEQRCIALALRLGAHALVVEETGESPVLLLDDVFSELDSHRCEKLIHLLPRGQALLTTTGTLPAGTSPAAIVRVQAGHLIPDLRREPPT
jgi:DNA replication and repair protein RecF